MDPNLILDVVNFVSLVDDPAVGDSEWVVMKREGEEAPETIQEALDLAKHGRTLSQSNQQRLADIYEDAQAGKIDAVAQELETFLQETVEEPETILPDGSGHTDMDTDKLEDLIKSVEESAEAAQEAAESAEDAAQQAQEASGESQNQPGDPEDPENPEGGQDGVSEEVMDRIEGLETRLQEAGVLEEPEDPEGSEGEGTSEGQEGQGSGDGPESDLEKRLASIEKSLEQGGRSGAVGVESEDDTFIRKDSGRGTVKDTVSVVEKSLQEQAAEEGGD